MVQLLNTLLLLVAAAVVEILVEVVVPVDLEQDLVFL
jgi:hypothetical protein